MAKEDGAIEFSPRSTAIASVRWEPMEAQASVGMLTVTFLGGQSYVHHDVPPGVVREFRVAVSAGGFYNREIKGKY
jgi:hypothetical protein